MKTTDEIASELMEGLERLPNGEWGYRTKEFDDWGFVRDLKTQDLIAVSKTSTINMEELKCREGTDPCELRGRHIALCSPAHIRSLLEERKAMKEANEAMKHLLITALEEFEDQDGAIMDRSNDHWIIQAASLMDGTEK